MHKFFTPALMLVSLYFFVCLPMHLFTQTISGIINIYTPVTAIGCNTLTVVSSAGYNTGDTILIIQMKGAEVDTVSNTAAFGSILNINEAGNYEFNIIQSINGNTIFLKYVLIKTYNPSGLVQLIRVPYYNNITVSSTLAALPWNGSVGGVLVFQAAGTVTLNANIDVSGLGFIGGIAMVNSWPGTCSSMNYYYTVASGLGGKKGEGITVYSTWYEAGRGALANGGGGGNNHNSGGGGGGNYGLGGRGGNQSWNFCPNLPIGGDGGYALAYTNILNKIFLGGGGGDGHHNDNIGTPGTNGGGIIIIKANTIVGNNFSIISNGINNILLAELDGAGGAGAGGAILLDINNYNLSLNIQANGGYGGSIANTIVYNGCWGTGGGGGGGTIWTSGASLPGNVSPSVNGGLPGLMLQGPCINTSNGADTGLVGGIVNNLQLVKSNVLVTPISITINSVNAICGISNGTATVTASGGTGTLTYSWSPGGQTTTTISGLGAGTYTATITDANGCTNTQTVNVNQSSSIAALATSTPTSCGINNGTATVTPSGGSSPYTYNWSPSGQTSSIATGLGAGTYTVSVVDASGCTSTTTVTVTSTGGPIANVSANLTIAAGSSATLSASGGTIYSWSNGASGSVIIVSPTTSTLYCVTVTDANNCTDLACVNVFVESPCDTAEEFFFPNAFSPNADGENDFLKIYYGNITCIKTLQLNIYNRWGEIIFETAVSDFSWDGKYNGKMLSTQVLTYYLQIEFTDQTVLKKKGNISLVR